MKEKSRIYHENVGSLNAFWGCKFDCVYCRPSFQRQAKRQKKNCLKCYNYTPHFHPERLLKSPPKTVGNEFIFFPSMGDPSFAEPRDFSAMIEYAEKYSDRRFLIQTKAPAFLKKYSFPDNVTLGITLETNLTEYSTPSKFKRYAEISRAPEPIERFMTFSSVKHIHKYVTIEPVLQHRGDTLTSWIREINPEVVYVGYDNYKCRLPEPLLSETKKLIKTLKEFAEVRIKNLREAWYIGSDWRTI